MKIKEIVNQHRRDFTAIYICEHCGNEDKSGGYDDANFHNNVIPQMKCKKCGEVGAKDYTPRRTKYTEGVQI